MHAAIRTAPVWSAIALLPLLAQEPQLRPPSPSQPQAQAPVADSAQPRPNYKLLSYPEDKEFVVAEIRGTPYTLEQLARYIEARHAPEFRKFLATDQGQLLLRSDLMAPWVRHFADIVALLAEIEARDVDARNAEPVLSAALKRTFEQYLDGYLQERRKHDPQLTLTAAQADRLRADFQMRCGIDCELQGWLDFLEPAEYTVPQLRLFFTDHAREFGGMVTFAHILVMHRDAGTGLLLDEQAQKAARARMERIKAELLPDGSNFQALARLRSEDTRSAADGGVLRNVTRFDRRLPALLCRTAWGLRDGEISDVVESEYGLHLAQRIELTQQQFLIFTEAVHPLVRQRMQESRQEDLLLAVRQRYHVTLHL